MTRSVNNSTLCVINIWIIESINDHKQSKYFQHRRLKEIIAFQKSTPCFWIAHQNAEICLRYTIENLVWARFFVSADFPNLPCGSFFCIFLNTTQAICVGMRNNFDHIWTARIEAAYCIHFHQGDFCLHWELVEASRQMYSLLHVNALT